MGGVGWWEGAAGSWVSDDGKSGRLCYRACGSHAVTGQGRPLGLPAATPIPGFPLPTPPSPAPLAPLPQPPPLLNMSLPPPLPSPPFPPPGGAGGGVTSSDASLHTVPIADNKGQLDATIAVAVILPIAAVVFGLLFYRHKQRQARPAKPRVPAARSRLSWRAESRRVQGAGGGERRARGRRVLGSVAVQYKRSAVQGPPSRRTAHAVLLGLCTQSGPSLQLALTSAALHLPLLLGSAQLCLAWRCAVYDGGSRQPPAHQPGEPSR